MASRSSKTIPGQAGGNAVVRQRGTNYMSEIGRRGGNAVVRKYGNDYMSLLGELGNQNTTKTRRLQVTRTINRAVRIANS